MGNRFKEIKYRKIISVVALGVVFFFIGYISALAFVGPTANPPGGGGAISTNASNFVGIGTTSPLRKFHVSTGGTPAVTDSNSPLVIGTAGHTGITISAGGSTNNAFINFGDDASTNIGQIIYQHASNAFNFQTNGVGDRMVIDSSGNVGIGTTSPGEKLDVVGNIKTSGSFIGALSGSLSAANVTQGVFGDNFGVFNYAFPGALAVGVNSTVGLQANSLYVNGNVGIGTTGPDGRLDVQGTNNSAGDIFTVIGFGNIPHIAVANLSSIADTWAGINFKAGSSKLTTAAIASQMKSNTTGEGVLIFGTTDSAGTTRTRMSITGSGNVGIGTAIPGFKLDVNGTARISGAITLAGDITFGGAAATNLNMNNKNISGVNKITVATIDPLYEIDGKKYSTYASAIAGGVKEEYVGRANLQLTTYNLEPAYEYVIDFNKVKEGSDLWVWRKAVDFSRDGVEVLATPYGAPATIYYQIEGEKIIFRATPHPTPHTLHPNAVEFSYRLVGRRFDWREWPTYAKDQGEQASFILK